MLNYKKILSCFFLLTISASSMAAGSSEDYDSDYYANEGRINFKARLFGALSKAKQKLPPPTSARGIASPQANPHFISNGFGIEGATTLFFGDYVAAELGLGFGMYKVSGSAVNSVSYNYGNGVVVGKKKQIYTIPLTFTMQYHIAPFGAFRPYVGAGYGGAYLFSRAKEFKIKNAHGVVGQIGMDIVMTTDTTFNIDIKKYSLEPKVTYKRNSIGTNLSSKVKISPWVIAVGMGIAF